MGGLTSDHDSNKNLSNKDYVPTNGSIVPHILLLAAQVIILSAPLFRGRRILSIGTILLLAFSAQRSRFSNDLATANFASLARPHVMATLDKVIFAGPQGPESDLWRIDKLRKEALGYAAFGFRKIRWAIVLLINLRGIRWNWQVKNVPEAPPRLTRGKFLIRYTYEFIRDLLMADILTHLLSRMVFADADGQLGNLDSKYLTLYDERWVASFLKTLVYGARPYYFINLYYLVFSIPCVALGISKPEDWPPLFGKISEVTTVRAFWGKYWHQMIRKVSIASIAWATVLICWFLNSYSMWLVRVFGIKRGTNTSAYLQLYVSFAISGVMHASGILLLLPPKNITFQEKTVGIVLYFLWQAVAITIEDFVQWFWKRNVRYTTKWVSTTLE